MATKSATLSRGRRIATKVSKKASTSSFSLMLATRLDDLFTQSLAVQRESRDLLEAKFDSLRRSVDQLAATIVNRPMSKDETDGLTRRRAETMLAEAAGEQGASAKGYADTAKQGEQARIEWTRNGVLLPTTRLAADWGLTRQGLDEATARHELFVLKIRGRLYAPAVFAELNREEVKRVCQSMPGADSESQLFFWTRPHGALGGKTPAQAIRAGQVARVVEIAQGLAEENGWAHAEAA
jgi:transposase InsO family protein